MRLCTGRATKQTVTVESQDIAGSEAVQDALRDWQAVRDSADIQFAPLPPIKPPEPPEWWRRFNEWLAELFEPMGRALGLSWPVIMYILIGLTILLVMFVVWRLWLRPYLERRGQDDTSKADADWTPDRLAAESLLDEADRLAAVGQFDEAVHLLLQRSVRHIAAARPDWLLPASTAREIAGFPMLSERARAAFGAIATRVERSLFGLRSLDEADWTAARAAYSDFALAELGT